MLIEFKVNNFQCFRDEVTLNLQPGDRDKELLGNIWEGHRYKTLKSAAIFGPNASGKTSLLHALFVFRMFVENSATKMNVGDLIEYISPFRLSSETRNKPSGFEVLVELDGVGYRYRVEATRERVWRELLECQGRAKNSKWKKLIDRDAKRDHVALHDHLGARARRDQIIEDTRDNALILSRAAERNVTQIAPLFKWFSQCIWHLNAGVGSRSDSRALQSIASAASDDPNLLNRLTDLVRDADTGIVRVGTETDPLPDDVDTIKIPEDLSSEEEEAFSYIKKGLEHLANLGDSKTEIDSERVNDSVRFFTEHGMSEGGLVRFSLGNESAGTRRYLRFAGLLLQHCATANLLAVDELNTSLHPQLARRVIQMAQSPAFGKAGAQLLFTTHDTTLLDSSLLRRDQIFLTQKGSDGAAELFSLWDFEEPPRNKAAWSRNYLAGRFGGVPVFGPSLADIPQADEPTPIESTASETVEVE